MSLLGLEKADLLENSAGTVSKLLYAFIWQEEVFDLGGANLSPEANAFEAALLPHVNELGNNLTSWSLHVLDIQAGGGYPGSGWCNDIVPHVKWHLETAAALADVARLADMVYRLVWSCSTNSKSMYSVHPYLSTFPISVKINFFQIWQKFHFHVL